MHMQCHVYIYMWMQISFNFDNIHAHKILLLHAVYTCMQHLWLYIIYNIIIYTVCMHDASSSINFTDLGLLLLLYIIDLYHLCYNIIIIKKIMFYFESFTQKYTRLRNYSAYLYHTVVLLQMCSI